MQTKYNNNEENLSRTWLHYIAFEEAFLLTSILKLFACRRCEKCEKRERLHLNVGFLRSIYR